MRGWRQGAMFSWCPICRWILCTTSEPWHAVRWAAHWLPLVASSSRGHRRFWQTRTTKSSTFMPMSAHVLQLSVKPKTPGEYGLPKHPVTELRITPSGADGDYNNYRQRTLAGDPDQAILLLTN